MGPSGGVAVGAEHLHAQAYSGTVTPYVFFAVVMAATGGLLFGYDVGVAGGVTSMSSFQLKFFPEVYARADDATQNIYCTYNDQVLQVFTSMMFACGMVSSLFASLATRRYGRRPSLLAAGALYSLGAALQAGARNRGMLYSGRGVLGCGVGVGNSVVPLYISEVAPFRWRGGLNQFFQLCTTIGILVAGVVNYGVREWTQGWRLSLGLAAAPGILLVLGAAALPETPNSLVERGRREEGLRVLRRLRGIEDVEAEMEDLEDAAEAARSVPVRRSFSALLSRSHRPMLVVTALVAFFQQWTGINAVIFYTPVLFASLANGDVSALLNAVIINSVNMASTLVAILTVDRLGRRFWFLEGGGQMLVSMAAAAAVFATGRDPASSGRLTMGSTKGALVVFCAFTSGFAWSWGPLGWLVPSEIQTLETRAAGMAVAVTVNFLFTFVIGQSFLSMLCAMQWGVFLFFAGFVVIMTVFVYFCLPETKEVPVERVQLTFARHPLWKRVMGRAADDVIEAYAARTATREARAAERGTGGADVASDAGGEADERGSDGGEPQEQGPGGGAGTVDARPDRFVPSPHHSAPLAPASAPSEKPRANGVPARVLHPAPAAEPPADPFAQPAGASGFGPAATAASAALPPTSGDLGAASAALPSTSGDLGAASAALPSTSGDLGAASAALPSTSGDLGAASAALPSTSGDLGAASAALPSTSGDLGAASAALPPTLASATFSSSLLPPGRAASSVLSDRSALPPSVAPTPQRPPEPRSLLGRRALSHPEGFAAFAEEAGGEGGSGGGEAGEDVEGKGVGPRGVEQPDSGQNGTCRSGAGRIGAGGSVEMAPLGAGVSPSALPPSARPALSPALRAAALARVSDSKCSPLSSSGTATGDTGSFKEAPRPGMVKSGSEPVLGDRTASLRARSSLSHSTGNLFSNPSLSLAAGASPQQLWNRLVEIIGLGTRARTRPRAPAGRRSGRAQGAPAGTAERRRDNGVGRTNDSPGSRGAGGQRRRSSRTEGADGAATVRAGGTPASTIAPPSPPGVLSPRTSRRASRASAGAAEDSSLRPAGSRRSGGQRRGSLRPQGSARLSVPEAEPPATRGPLDPLEGGVSLVVERAPSGSADAAILETANRNANDPPPGTAGGNTSDAGSFGLGLPPPPAAPLELLSTSADSPRASDGPFLPPAAGDLLSVPLPPPARPEVGADGEDADVESLAGDADVELPPRGSRGPSALSGVAGNWEGVGAATAEPSREWGRSRTPDEGRGSSRCGSARALPLASGADAVAHRSRGSASSLVSADGAGSDRRRGSASPCSRGESSDADREDGRGSSASSTISRSASYASRSSFSDTSLRSGGLSARDEAQEGVENSYLEDSSRGEVDAVWGPVGEVDAVWSWGGGGSEGSYGDRGGDGQGDGYDDRGDGDRGESYDEGSYDERSYDAEGYAQAELHAEEGGVAWNFEERRERGADPEDDTPSDPDLSPR